MEAAKILTIKTEYLPKDWVRDSAEKFSLAPITIRKIANGERNNGEVFDHLLALAEQGKRAEKERIDRATELAKPLEA